MNSPQKQDRAKSIFENANFWISNVDTKISFIIGFTGIFLGFLFSSDSISTSIENYIITLSNMTFNNLKFVFTLISIFLFILTLFFIIKAVYQLMEALQGRIDPNTYKQKDLEIKSSIFWGTIASMDYPTFKKTFDDSEEQQLNDIQSQAYINSLITKIKFEYYNKGIKNLKNGIVVFIIFKLLTYVPI